MRKALFAVLFVSFLAACNSNGNGKSAGDTISGPNVTTVPNANGNMPDTSNSINLSTTAPDSSAR